jgi:hypothetical protein
VVYLIYVTYLFITLVKEIVMNFLECAFPQEHDFEQLEEKLYKEYTEIGGFREKHVV